jgi:hypothetical protein
LDWTLHSTPTRKAVEIMRRAAFLALLALASAACAETRRALGEECVKNDDCLSGVCVARACDHPPKALDRPLPPTLIDAESPPIDAAADTTTDAGSDAVLDVGGGG